MNSAPFPFECLFVCIFGMLVDLRLYIRSNNNNKRRVSTRIVKNLQSWKCRWARAVQISTAFKKVWTRFCLVRYSLVEKSMKKCSHKKKLQPFFFFFFFNFFFFKYPPQLWYTIQLYCLYVEKFAFWLVIYIKTFDTVNNKTSTT